MAKGLAILWKKEGRWAVWLGLGLVVLALPVYAGGSHIMGWAATPGICAINAFAVTKAIGSDIWIGIWCLILSGIPVILWERKEGGAKQTVGPGVIWERFPKSVFGIFAASVIKRAVAASPPADHLGAAPVEGGSDTKVGKIAYLAAFESFTPPVVVGQRFGFDSTRGEITSQGTRSCDDFESLEDAIPSRDPDTIPGNQNGVAVSAPTGHFLSTVVFTDHWSRI